MVAEDASTKIGILFIPQKQFIEKHTPKSLLSKLGLGWYNVVGRLDSEKIMKQHLTLIAMAILAIGIILGLSCDCDNDTCDNDT